MSIVKFYDYATVRETIPSAIFSGWLSRPCVSQACLVKLHPEASGGIRGYDAVDSFAYRPVVAERDISDDRDGAVGRPRAEANERKK